MLVERHKKIIIDNGERTKEEIIIDDGRRTKGAQGELIIDDGGRT